MTKSEHLRELMTRAGASGPKGPYLAYFYFFNRQQFYEAHDVLEALWLPERKGANNDFYKALIQVAGAFVHLQKGRVQPSVSLFKLARSYLEKYPTRHEGLNVGGVLEMIDEWVQRVERDPAQNSFDLTQVSLTLGTCD